MFLKLFIHRQSRLCGMNLEIPLNNLIKTKHFCNQNIAAFVFRSHTKTAGEFEPNKCFVVRVCAPGQLLWWLNEPNIECLVLLKISNEIK